MMQTNAAATVVRKSLKIDALLSTAPAPRRAPNDWRATRQLQFAYLPVNAVTPFTSEAAKLLVRWLKVRSASISATLPTPDVGNCSGLLSNADRFNLGHAASALMNLQSMGMAGRTVIHLSTSCLMAPWLPDYVISLFQRRGVSLAGIAVSLGSR